MAETYGLPGHGTGGDYVRVDWQIKLISQAGANPALWPFVREIASITALNCFKPEARKQLMELESDYRRGEQA